MTARLLRATVRQALVGLLVAAASLPLVLALGRALGVPRPPTDGILLLGGTVALAFAGGGLLGALAAAVMRGSRRRVRLLASLAGLVWGIFLCSVALPFYTQDVLDDMTDQGTEAALAHVDTLLERPSGALDQAADIAGGLIRDGAARLPALALLGWAVIGPTLVAPLEARPPKPGMGKQD